MNLNWIEFELFWQFFIPTEDLGDPFFLILCLLKILVTDSCRFYAYWRSWRPILADFMPTEDLGDPSLPILCLLKILASQWGSILVVFVLVSFLFLKILILVKFKKRSCKGLGTDETGLIWNGMIIWNAIRKLIVSFWKKKKL